MIPAIAGIVGAIGKGLDGLLTSDEERLRGERDLMREADRPYADQREINKVEAAHRSVWVSGWRPAIGWTCWAGLTYYFLVWPVLTWASTIFGIEAPPTIDIESLFTLVLSLLGLGGLRTYEKWKGLTR